MTIYRFSAPNESALQARLQAARVAFGPVVFQCAHYAWKRGILAALAEGGEAGRTVEEMKTLGPWSDYALKLVLESCMSAGLVMRTDDRYQLDKAGYCLLSDAVTQVNMDFVQDVCYHGLGDLAASLDSGRPIGLRTLGPWSTLYEGMSELPEPARTSWFAFDHLHSDVSFPLVLQDVMESAPRKVMDIGANTGKFARLLLQHAHDIEMHLVDLPGQLAMASQTLDDAQMLARASLHPRDLLNPAHQLPGPMDLIWMSQFLSCFSEEVISTIFERVAAALAPKGQVLVLDTFWDRQRYEVARYCLINTSPYFTAMASGNSKVYESKDYLRLAKQAGLQLVSRRDGIGYSHTLLRFTRQS